MGEADNLTGTATAATYAGAAWRVGYALVAAPLLWGWFVVPLGVPPISWTHALGLALVADAFRFRPGRLTSEQQTRELVQAANKDPWIRLFARVLVSLACLAIGWAVR